MCIIISPVDIEPDRKVGPLRLTIEVGSFQWCQVSRRAIKVQLLLPFSYIDYKSRKAGLVSLGGKVAKLTTAKLPI